MHCCRIVNVIKNINIKTPKDKMVSWKETVSNLHGNWIIPKGRFLWYASNELIHCCLHRNMPKACPYVMIRFLFALSDNSKYWFFAEGERFLSTGIYVSIAAVWFSIYYGKKHRRMRSKVHPPALFIGWIFTDISELLSSIQVGLECVPEFRRSCRWWMR